jgi:hypothetical protein
MVTIIQRTWSKPAGSPPLIARLLSEHPALYVLLDEPVGAVKLLPRTTRERLHDDARLRRMLQLMADGMQPYPAAGQACRESCGGASEYACQRRLVRKYLARKLPRQAT